MLHKCTITAPEEEYDTITGLLSVHSLGWQEETLANGDTRYTLFDRDITKLKTIAEVVQSHTRETHTEMETQEECDWQEKWRKSLKPIECGNFLVLPPWEKSTNPKAISILIEPKNAFGTGEHATTALCLKQLSALADKNALPKGQFLDLGTGSGILAIAAAKLGLCGLCLDIEEDAIANAKENAKRNNVETKLSFGCGSIELCSAQSYSLIFANILAEPLRNMASQIVSKLTPSGILILSGFLDIQTEALRKVYENLGIDFELQSTEGEWVALMGHLSQ